VQIVGATGRYISKQKALSREKARKVWFWWAR
jgi:hypothetical protein